MFVGDGGGHGEVEETRRRRDRMFQLGLFSCLIMILLDAKSAPLESERSTTVGNSGSAIPKRPYQQLKKVLLAQSGDGRLYASNITGKYSGNWTRIQYASGNETFGRARTSMAPKFKLSSRHGHVAMQVYSKFACDLWTFCN